MIYLDSNATTMMPRVVTDAFLEWCNRGNPSAGYKSAKNARAMMNGVKQQIGNLCGITTCCVEDRDRDSAAGLPTLNAAKSDSFRVVFTSGASEANCTALRSICDAYYETRRVIPHVVISAVEHKSLLLAAQDLEERGHITTTYVAPSATGHVLASSVEAAIRADTALVCVMHANNETGAINDIAEIGRIAHARNVVFHCDSVQSFGKTPLQPLECSVDSFCISFHKLHGPPGIGAWIVKQKLVVGYKLKPMIYGTQNAGMRGGTENLPAIGASGAALTYTMHQRKQKNARLQRIKHVLMEEFATRLPCTWYTDFSFDATEPVEICFLSGVTDYLCNTILLSVVWREGVICNTKLKTTLEKRNIVVSVGSACNTANSKASHVLYAMNVPDVVRRGTLRVSLNDNNTVEDAKKFVYALLQAVREQTGN